MSLATSLAERSRGWGPVAAPPSREAPGPATKIGDVT